MKISVLTSTHKWVLDIAIQKGLSSAKGRESKDRWLEIGRVVSAEGVLTKHQWKRLKDKLKQTWPDGDGIILIEQMEKLEVVANTFSELGT